MQHVGCVHILEPPQYLHSTSLMFQKAQLPCQGVSVCAVADGSCLCSAPAAGPSRITSQSRLSVPSFCSRLPVLPSNSSHASSWQHDAACLVDKVLVVVVGERLGRADDLVQVCVHQLIHQVDIVEPAPRQQPPLQGRQPCKSACSQCAAGGADGVTPAAREAAGQRDTQPQYQARHPG